MTTDRAGQASPFDEPVGDFATPNPFTVSPDDPPHEVARRLDALGVSAALVALPDGRLCGVVSTTDLLRALPTRSPGGAEPARAVRDLMRSPVVAVGAGAPVREAAALMVRHRIHRVVVAEGGRGAAVLTTHDLMRAALRSRLDAPLGAVMSAPVETIDVGEPIAEAVRRLEAANVRGLVVVDGAWPVGVFTHTEALRTRHLAPPLLETPVEQVMSYETICLDVKTPLYRVAGHFVQMNVRRVLAVEARSLRGIASGFDLARAVAGEAGSGR
ncbi:MAG TPA: CBS domain-containing protein [Polyangiaceae bacterium]|nr:CBS domain-containing protein [Polyangiaceae bacterium]